MEVTVMQGDRGGRTEAVRPAVYDENMALVPGVEVVSVSQRLGRTPGEAVLEVVMDSFVCQTINGAEQQGQVRIESVQEDGAPVGLGQWVWVGLPLAEGGVLTLFGGLVEEWEGELSAKTRKATEGVQLVARDARVELMRTEIVGSYHYDPQTGRTCPDLAAVMNPNGMGNRDLDHTWQPGGETPLFADANIDAGTWSGRDALAYVMGHYKGEVQLDMPPEGLSTDALSGELEEMSLEGESCAGAIWKVLDWAGLEGWVDGRTATQDSTQGASGARASLSIVDPATAPTRNAKLGSAGSTFAPGSSEVSEAKIRRSAQKTSNQWRIRGRLKEYEARFEMVKLWTSADEATVIGGPNIGRRGHEAYDGTMDHVFRQWGLNEDGRWKERATYDFSGLFTGAVKRRRQLLPPFRTSGGDVRPMVVEIQAPELDAGWQRAGNGAVRTLADRAGVYFDCEDIDGQRSGIWAGTARTFVPLQDITAVRVTAVVESDERVTTTSQRQDESTTETVIEKTITDEMYRWQMRDASSIYEEEGTGVLQDDSAAGGAMEERADALREQHEGAGVTSSLSIPWIDVTWRPGTRVQSLAGRGLDFRAAGGDSPGYPLVSEVTWNFAEQRTTLKLGNAT